MIIDVIELDLDLGQGFNARKDSYGLVKGDATSTEGMEF